jgi:hypothetical protein
MAPSIPETVAPAALSAEELLLHLLNIITHLQSTSDLTVENLSAAMQRPALMFGTRYFGYEGTLTSEWGYALEVDKAGTSAARLDLNFIDTTPEKRATATDICKVDFDQFAALLGGAGFKRETIRGEHNRIVYDRFDRQNLSVTVASISETSKPSGEPMHACVRLVTVEQASL